MQINAHVPTQQYGFIDLQDLPDDPAAVEKIYNRYAETPIKLTAGKKTAAFVGGSINYDEASHTYSWNGERYLSGSEYAKSFEKPFDLQGISEAMGKKFALDPAEIRAMWKLKADISTGIGTALHAALELYGKYHEMAEVMGKSGLHDSLMVNQAVKSFFRDREDQKAVYEAVIVDHDTKRAGRVDRIMITGDKECVVEDFKTGDVGKRMDIYCKQLDFYAQIMESHGWKVRACWVRHWDGKVWKDYECPRESKVDPGL